MEMAIDVLDMSAHLDSVVLCTGDGDFQPLVAALARRGKHVEVCGLREMTSTDLIAAADEYIDLASLKDELVLAGAPPLPREVKNEMPTSDQDEFNTFKVQDTSFDF
jgi:uncharacterized LabA/DUF88 family protein